MKRTVFCIGLGGTASAEYGVTDQIKSGVSEFESFHPAFVEIIKTIDAAGSSVDFAQVALFQKDSNEITPEDIRKVKDVVEATEYRHIIVECGLDKMVDIAKEFKDYEKTIVFTGSTIPEEQEGTEYRFNFGMALGASQLLPPGAYIAMNAAILPVDNAVRDIKTGIFEKVGQNRNDHGKIIPLISYGF